MLDRLVFALVALAVLVGVSADALAQDRFALVIGNSKYRTVEELPNPVRDADAIADLLESAKFEVITATDLSQSEMRRAVRDFATRLAEQDEDSVALIYFAGHGLQIDGQNYLLPVDARVTRESDVALEGVRLADIMNVLDTVPSKTRIVILDACRNNPFGAIADQTGRGLAIVNAPAGTVVAYSTSPGAVAEDGSGVNSPFTKELIKAAREPGAPLGTVFQNVRLAVHEQTDGRQTPWEVTALTEPFLFFPGEGPAKVADSVQRSEEAWRKELRTRSPREAYEVVVRQDNVIVYEIFLTIYADTSWGRRIRGIMDRRLEMLAWFEAIRLGSPDAFEEFLRRYPKSDLALTAKRLKERAKLRSLVASKTPVAMHFAPVPEVRTITKEVRVPVVKEVVRIKEVPVVKEVVRIKEVRVPVVKEVVKIKTVKVPVVKTVIKKVPVVKTVTVVKKVPVPIPCRCKRPNYNKGPSINIGPQFRIPRQYRRRH